ncbi:MAG: TetR/AcrR family transcriptional regulator [Acidobacteriota bacterium]|nr:TetR/AcrR family transcriptional regulator [Acidobacteriota bacterium]
MKSPEAKSEAATRPAGRREANVAARRQRILESARTLLKESGPEGLSMRKLAKDAGLSVTTLYNLLGSREAILQALIRDSDQRLEAAAPDAGAARTPLRRASRAMEGVLRYMIDNGDLLRPLIVAHFGSGYVATLGKADQGEHFRSAKEAIRAAIGEAQASGQLRKTVGQEFLEAQLYAGWGLALDQWAFGLIDDETLRLRSLSGFYVGLLAIAEPEVRPGFENELRRLERQLAAVDSRRGSK